MQYYYEKNRRIISVIHPEVGINPLLLKSDKSDFSLMPKGRISADWIKSEFINTRQLTFEVTERCNLDCFYCSQGHLYDHEGKRSKNLDFLYAKNLIDFLCLHKDTSLYTWHDQVMTISFYGGEPLLNFNLITKIINYCECKFKKIQFSMTTNAVLLDKYMDYLVEKNFYLLISLDGNRTNNQYRTFNNKQESFIRVFNNVMNLQEKHPEYFKNNVNFNSVFHDKSSIEDIYTFFKNNFNKIPKISELNPYGILVDHKDKFESLYNSAKNEFQVIDGSKINDEDLALLNPSSQSLTVFTASFSGVLFNTYKDLFVDKKNINYIPTGTCLPFSRKIFLNVKGQVFPCERIERNYPLGNVSKDKVEINFDKIASFYNSIYDKYNKMCEKCYNIGNCFSCLFNDMDKKEQVKCESFLSKNKFEEYVSYNLNIFQKNPEYFKNIMDNSILV